MVRNTSKPAIMIEYYCRYNMAAKKLDSCMAATATI